METWNKDRVLQEHDAFIEKIRSGKLFVYPTDTIYGVGCDATNFASVLELRKAKQRPDKPVSVIAPSMEWILKNCKITRAAHEWLQKLPGPYTLILKTQGNILNDAVLRGAESVGVRIPHNWLTPLIQQSGRPFVTTSVNLTGEPHLVDPKKLSEAMKERVDVLIDDGLLEGSASTLVDLTGAEPVLRKR